MDVLGEDVSIVGGGGREQAVVHELSKYFYSGKVWMQCCCLCCIKHLLCPNRAILRAVSFMIRLSRDGIRGGAILIVSQYTLKPKFTPRVNRSKCWLEYLVVEEDKCCCYISSPPPHMDPDRLKKCNVVLNDEVRLAIHQQGPTSSFIPAISRIVHTQSLFLDGILVFYTQR